MDFCFFGNICYENIIMEIREIISYFLDKQKNILEINFRTIEDDEDVQRVDTIDYTIVSEYGYELETESFNFFGMEDEVEEDVLETELDEDELVNFLNEYYTINPQSLPKSDYF